MSRNWLAVASAEHVRIGRRAGFMQVCHGRARPLQRVQPGDRVVYYSPTGSFRGRDRLQAFTAVGTVRDGPTYQADIYQADRGSRFRPHRRDVDWHDAVETPLAALQDCLALCHERNWGYRLRLGLIEISERDMATIAEAMFTTAAPPCRRACGSCRG